MSPAVEIDVDSAPKAASSAPLSPSGSAPPAQTASPPPFAAARAIGVAMIAAVSSSVMSQINVLAVPDLAAMLHVSADDASWIATVTSMAEISIIPIAALLTVSLGLRRLAMLSSVIYALSAFGSLAASSLDVFLVARVALALAGGVMPVMMMATVMASVKPGRQRQIALAIFAFSSSIPGAIAPSLGGWLLDADGGRGLALAEIVWSSAFFGIASLALAKAPVRSELLRQADWSSYLPVTVTLACIVLVLSQGERHFWFDSPLIATVSSVALASGLVAAVMLLSGNKPLIDLRLLGKATFGWAFVIAIVFRFGLLASGYITPQILMRLQDFRLPEIGDAVIWIGLTHLVFFPVAWWAASRVDARVSLTVGLGLFSTGSLSAAGLTPDWQGQQYLPALLLIGIGQAFYLVPVLYYATAGVSATLGATAASLFNIARVLGQVFGTAVIATIVTEREKLHSARLVERLTDGTPWFAERLDSATSQRATLHADAAYAQLQGLADVASAAGRQAFVQAYADAFLVIGVVLAAAAYLVLMLPRLPSDTPDRSSEAVA